MRIISRLDRHVVQGVTVPSLLALLVYTLLLVMNGLFALMEQVVVFGVSLEDAARLMLIGLPNVLIITIPVSFLFGALLASGRMTTDNEMIALQAGGVSPLRLYKPILAIALLLTVVCAYLSEAVIPGATRTMKELRREMFSAGEAIGRIQPKVFYDELPNILLYIQDIDSSTGHWKNVLIHRTVSPDEEQLTLANRGRRVTTVKTTDSAIEDKGASWILLEDIVTHTMDRKHPEKFLTSTVQTHLFRPEEEQSGRTSVTYRLSLRELSGRELWAMLEGSDFFGILDPTEADPAEVERHQRLAGLEFNRRIAVPAVSLTFALLALPLGIGTRAGGRGKGFLYSILVVLFYFVLNSYGEFLVMEHGVPPWAGIWFPNIVLTGIGVFLAARMGRWLGERQAPERLPVRLSRAFRTWRINRRLKGAGNNMDRPLTGSIPIGIQRRRYGAGFPTLMDRYLARRMLTPLFLVLLSTTSLYIIGDLTNHIDEIARNSAPANVVIAYYLNIIPGAVFDVLPFAMLIAVISVLTVLERHLELTAFKAGGLSVFRVMVPLVLISVMGSGAMWALSEKVIPEASRKSYRHLDRIKGRTTPRGFATDRNWILARDGRTYYTFLRFDMDSETLIRFSMYRIDQQMRLRYQFSAPRVRFENGSWFADGGWVRNIDEEGVDEYQKITRKTEVGIPEAPRYFGQEHRRPSEMVFSDLGQYIRELKDSGYRPSPLVVRWHQKITGPLSTLILVFLAIPFAVSRVGDRASNLHGVATAVILGIGYFILMVPLFGKLGEAEFLPPVVGAWAPVVIATVFALNRMTTVRT